MDSLPDAWFSAARAAAVAALVVDGIGYGIDAARFDGLRGRFLLTADDPADVLADAGVAAFAAVTSRRPAGPAGVYLLAEVAELVVDRQVDPRSDRAHLAARVADCLRTEKSPSLPEIRTPAAYTAAVSADLGVVSPVEDKGDELVSLLAQVVVELAGPPA